MSEKNTRVILRIEIEKKGDQTKATPPSPPPLPSPLLPADPSHHQTSSQSLLSPPLIVATPPCPRAPLGGVMARRKVSKSAQIIFNNQQRLVVALNGIGGVVQMGGDDDR